MTIEDKQSVQFRVRTAYVRVTVFVCVVRAHVIR